MFQACLSIGHHAKSMDMAAKGRDDQPQSKETKQAPGTH